MSYFELDAKQFDSVVEAIKKFSDGSQAEEIINEYLWGEGAEKIGENIKSMLPVSGRTWSKKRAAASVAEPFTKEEGNLSVKIKTVNGYHYLYFPDDGENTVKHFGNQQFMFQGASNKAEEIANNIIKELLERLKV